MLLDVFSRLGVCLVFVYLTDGDEAAFVGLEEDHEGVPLLHLDHAVLHRLRPTGLVHLRRPHPIRTRSARTGQS